MKHISAQSTAIFAMFFSVVLGATVIVLTFYTLYVHRQLGDWMSGSPSNWLSKLFQDNSAAIENVLFSRQVPQESEIPTVRVTIEKNGFKELNHQILEYGFGKMESKPKIKGYAKIDDGKVYPVSIRFRGANTWHHQYWKPSLRIKYKSKRIVDGYRDHVLIAPEDGIGLRNLLSSLLAERWGELSNGEHFVRLFVNNRFFGVYTRSWRMDESLLINMGRLPGPFFRLESMTGPAFKRHHGSLKDYTSWEYEGITPEEGASYLRNLVEAIEISDEKKRNARLEDLVDGPSAAKWLALYSHAASVHVDTHNVALWLDTTSGKFQPVAVDVNGYDYTHKGYDNLCPTFAPGFFLGRWMENPDNLNLYILTLHELVTGLGSYENMRTEINEIWRKTRDQHYADKMLSDTGNRNGTYTRSFVSVRTIDTNFQNVLKFVKARTSWLRHEIEKMQLQVTPKEEGKEFTVAVRGLAHVVVKRKDGAAFEVPQKGRVKEAKILPSLTQTCTGKTGDSQGEARVTFLGSPEDFEFRHGLTDELLNSTPFEQRELAAVAGEIKTPKGELPIFRLGPGEVILRETREYRGTLEIAPGTKILMAPDVSVLVRGNLRVKGTQGQPVVVRPLSSEKPFGTFAVVGPECDGSRVSYLDMEGGSVGRFLNLKFSGMFSVRDCSDVTVEHSHFARNKVGDDTVHIVRSHANFHHNVVTDSLFDAVDWDQVTGTMSSNTFVNSGNDGADLSMSKVKIEDLRFSKSGDKCISLGEGSEVNITGSVFNQCKIGVAIKDRSVATISESEFDKNEVAVTLYRKKWKWGTGGTVSMSNVKFEGSTKWDFFGDKHSRLTLLGKSISEYRLGGELKVNPSQGRDQE